LKNNRVARGELGGRSPQLQPPGARQRAKALGYVYEGRLRPAFDQCWTIYRNLQLPDRRDDLT
jgi:hypothetical protein